MKSFPFCCHALFSILRWLLSDKSSDGAYSKTTKTSYTVLRSQDNGLDTVDASVPTDSGSSTKAFIILGLIFLLALVALGVLYKGFPELDK